MDEIWRNAARKVRERATQAITTSTPNSTITATIATTDFPRPSAELEKLWRKTARLTAKTAWQRD